MSELDRESTDPRDERPGTESGQPDSGPGDGASWERLPQSASDGAWRYGSPGPDAPGGRDPVDHIPDASLDPNRTQPDLDATLPRDPEQNIPTAPLDPNRTQPDLNATQPDLDATLPRDPEQKGPLP